MKYNDYYLAHYGVKGMKWGVRRYQNADGSLTPAGQKHWAKLEKKQAKKDVNRIHKALNGTRAGAEVASTAAFSKLGKGDYEAAAKLVSSGRLLVSATFKKNYADKSVDIFMGGSKDPVMKARMTDGENFVVDFVNKNDKANATAFMKYYNDRSA